MYIEYDTTSCVVSMVNEKGPSSWMIVDRPFVLVHTLFPSKRRSQILNQFHSHQK
jgi:ribosomal silencing factor RsfS